MFLLSVMVVAYGKGGAIVVSTTDLCTLSLIATITWGSDMYADTGGKHR